ncbi:MAG TPA: class I SAM-dependent methyltransferase [Treponemataceae bacterium]|nr:class I SAM-dependent methyltransferase [Treponemataceae bacterium]HQL05963.1 class I SAM-dependent methyltransferase [Treponemataceae bacterium]
MNNKLSLYERSKDFLWTDDYISANMLDAHLNPDIDAVSRNRTTILKTVDWIDSVLPKKGSLLDLGCGPGLYAQEFAQKGYTVTGIDISKRSIEYAKKSAQEKKLSITYINGDYINKKIEGKFDAAVCIYCDFGALIPSEQKAFLKMSVML